jgi:ABC-2 type transport system permease protein
VWRPASNPLLRLPVGSGLYEQRSGILGWSVGCLLAAAFIASIGRQMVTLVNGGGALGAYLTVAGHGDPYVALTGFFWFGIFEMLLAVFAITQVSRWSADDSEGRLEMILSAPVSRTRVVAERAATLLAATAVVVSFSSAGFYLAARSAGINLGLGDLFTASWPLLLFALSFAALGALLASRVPRATVAALATLAFVSYLVTDIAPLLKWPDWTTRLSLFSLYGNPLANGVYWTGVWTLLAITLVGFGLAALLMRRRQVGA